MRLLILMLVLTGCSMTSHKQPETPRSEISNERVQLRQLSFSALPGWDSDNHAEALAAFRRSCAAIVAAEPSRRLNAAIPGFERYSAWQSACRLAQRTGETEAKAFFEQEFSPFRVANSSGEATGKFTGYYQISLKGSRTKTARYRFPIYARPKDLVERKGKQQKEWGRIVAGRFVPYPSRAEIEQHGLAGRARVLFWADNAIDVFLLHIQGSGVVRLPDGSEHGIGFAGRNGRPYSSIGTVLIQQGHLKPAETHIPSIRAWLERNPSKQREILSTNSSYIFFKENGHRDPIGAMGVPLSPQRSLAVDAAMIPYGAPLWVDIPENERLPGGLKRLMIAQDTGAAILGAVRGDVFWGHDALAEQRAGLMNNPGQYYILLPRQLLLADAS